MNLRSIDQSYSSRKSFSQTAISTVCVVERSDWFGKALVLARPLLLRVGWKRDSEGAAGEIGGYLRHGVDGTGESKIPRRKS